MRCHSQGLTIKLKKDIPLAEIEAMLANDNAWVKVVPNEREATERELSPAKISTSMWSQNNYCWPCCDMHHSAVW
jgi:aspartate-semialdehyde dehydrogenase